MDGVGRALKFDRPNSLGIGGCGNDNFLEGGDQIGISDRCLGYGCLRAMLHHIYLCEIKPVMAIVFKNYYERDTWVV